MRTLALLAAIFASSHFINAQYMDFEWGLQTDSIAHNQINWFDVDPAGDIYMIQQFLDTVDADPGPGTFTLAPQNNQGWAVLKISQTGNLIWARNFTNEVAKIGGTQLHVTSQGVVVIGQFHDSLDLDPGAGQQMVYSDSLCGFILALDNAGNYQWGGHLPSTHYSYLSALTVDENNSVWIAGMCAGITDLDPSTLTNTIAVQTAESSGFILKLDQQGNASDLHLINSKGYTEITSVCIDPLKNVIVAGTFSGTTDFDPGAATHTITAFIPNSFVLKLDSLGTFQWVWRAIGTHGTLADTDSSGNIYCTGTFGGSVDFDPTSAQTILSAQLFHYYLLKLNPTGALTWAVTSGSSCYANAHSIAVTKAGDVYITGDFLIPTVNGQITGSMDLDHGTGVQLASPINGAGSFLIRTRQDGSFVWGGSIDFILPGNNVHIDADLPNEIYYHGIFSEYADIDPGTGIYQVRTDSLSTSASYIGKLKTCDLFPDLSRFRKTCAAQTTTLHAAGGGTVSWYTDMSSSLPIHIGSNYTLTPSAPGHFSLAVASSQCRSPRYPVTVLVMPQPLLSVTGKQDTICEGEVATYSLQGAVSYSFNGTPAASVFTFVPNAQTQYSVQGISSDGCIAEQTFIPPVEHCSSVGELSSATIRIYPNPAHDYFVVASPQDRTNLFLYDSQGAIVLECELRSGNNTISTGKLPKGIYFVMMAGENLTPYRLLIQ